MLLIWFSADNILKHIFYTIWHFSKLKEFFAYLWDLRNPIIWPSLDNCPEVVQEVGPEVGPEVGLEDPIFLINKLDFIWKQQNMYYS